MLSGLFLYFLMIAGIRPTRQVSNLIRNRASIIQDGYAIRENAHAEGGKYRGY
jgi:hypothetical protein